MSTPLTSPTRPGSIRGITPETPTERELLNAQTVKMYVEAWQRSQGNGRTVPDAIQARILELLKAT